MSTRHGLRVYSGVMNASLVALLKDASKDAALAFAMFVGFTGGAAAGLALQLPAPGTLVVLLCVGLVSGVLAAIVFARSVREKRRPIRAVKSLGKAERKALRRFVNQGSRCIQVTPVDAQPFRGLDEAGVAEWRDQDPSGWQLWCLSTAVWEHLQRHPQIANEPDD